MTYFIIIMLTSANIIITNNEDYTELFYQKCDGYISGGLGAILMCELEEYCFTHCECNCKDINKLLKLRPTEELCVNSQYLYIITVSKYNINLKAYSFFAIDSELGKIKNLVKKINKENFNQILLDKTNLLVYDETYICNQQTAINNIDESINISKEKLSEYCFNFTELNQNMVQYSDKQIAMLKGITSKLDRLISLLKNKQ